MFASWAGKNLFQFLLGRLKTSNSGTKQGLKKEFQFLLGRLKTSSAKYSCHTRSAWFQFLLGRLKTGFVLGKGP